MLCTQQVVERVLDLVCSNRLEEHFAKLRRLGRSGEVSCSEHDSNARLQLLRVDRQFNAVEVRHDHVSEKHIDVLSDENAHRFRGAAGHEYSEARSVEDFRDRSTD